MKSAKEILALDSSRLGCVNRAFEEAAKVAEQYIHGRLIAQEIREGICNDIQGTSEEGIGNLPRRD